MKQKTPSNAGILSVITAVILILAIYTLLGTVDLVYVKDGRQVDRVNDVNVISEITLPEGELSYVVDGETKTLDSVDDLRAHIGITLITNLISFKWQEVDRVITITQN